MVIKKNINLFIHIGTHKTGTTAIQKFLSINEKNLLSNGYIYHKTDDFRNAHHQFAYALANQNYEAISAYVHSIESFAKKNNIDNVIISSEEFENITDCRKLEILKKFNVHVIAFLRRHDHYLESEYAQLVAMNETRFQGSIYKLYMRNQYTQRFNYLNIYNIWLSISQEKNINFLPYRENQDEFKIFKRFLLLLGIKNHTKFITPEYKYINKSLSPLGTIHLSRINALDITIEQRNLAVQLLSEIYPKNNSDRLIDDIDISRILDKYKAQYKQAKDTFGFRFDLEIKKNNYIDYCSDFNIKTYDYILNNIR